jgi:hypothetical protein
MKFIAGIIGGLIIAIIGVFDLAVAGASRPESIAGYGLIVFIALWIVGIVIAVMAPSAVKAWRRLLITSGLLSFLLPLSAIFFTGSQVAGTLERGGEFAAAATAGTAIGGGIITGMMGILGFSLGAIFLVTGLLIGRDKQVIYVQAPPEVKN